MTKKKSTNSTVVYADRIAKVRAWLKEARDAGELYGDCIDEHAAEIEAWYPGQRRRKLAMLRKVVTLESGRPAQVKGGRPRHTCDACGGSGNTKRVYLCGNCREKNGIREERVK